MVREGTYVRIFGVFKTFGNKRQVQAFRIRPVTDMNEVTYHALECMLTHARMKRSVCYSSCSSIL